jgi:hypothetical protein
MYTDNAVTGQKRCITLSADISSLSNLLRSGIFPQVVDSIIDFPHGLAELFCVDCEREAANTTDEIRIVFKPSKRLLNLIATLGARNLDAGFIE